MTCNAEKKNLTPLHVGEKFPTPEVWEKILTQTKGRAIIFLTWGRGGGGSWKFSQGNIYLYAAPAANKLLVSPSSCKHSFLLVYHLFQCLQPISKFSTPPPPF